MAGTFLVSCLAGTGCQAMDDSARSRQATLTARPSATTTTHAAGTHALGLGSARDAVLYLPTTAGQGPLPLIVLFHGAGSSGAHFMRHLAAATESLRAAILAPDSVDGPGMPCGPNTKRCST